MLSPRARIVAAGLAIAAGIILVNAPAHACDERSGRGCSPASDQTATTAKSKPTAARPRQVAVRAAAATKAADRRKRHASSHKSRKAKADKALSHAAPTSPSRQLTSAAARRFREFVSPRSIAANPIDDLQRPRLDASDLTGKITYTAVTTKWQVASNGMHAVAQAEQALSQDELNEIDLAAIPIMQRYPVMSADIAFGGAQAVRQDLRQDPSNEVVRSVTADRAPSGMTWLQLIFLTWGGILTVASVLRLVLG